MRKANSMKTSNENLIRYLLKKNIAPTYGYNSDKSPIGVSRQGSNIVSNRLVNRILRIPRPEWEGVCIIIKNTDINEQIVYDIRSQVNN